MAPKKSDNDSRIQGFKSLGMHEAAKEQGRIAIGEVNGYQLRRIWHHGEWWHSVVDVVGALSESADGRKYWNKLKQRLGQEGSEVVTDCHQLPLTAADGKMRATDCATTAALFRIVQSVPSKNAEPIKAFLAQTGAERLEEIASPSLAVDRAIENYRQLGREEEWIDHRLQNISARNELTEQWQQRKVAPKKFGELTNEMSAIAMGIQPKAHAGLKGVPTTELREHMDKTELAITTVAEASAKAIIVHRDTQTFDDTKQASLDGAHVAKAARDALELQLNRSVATKSNFLPKVDGSDTPLFAAKKGK